jgi:hypothetical protein
MTTLIDRVADILYPNDGLSTADIKFFCAGDNHHMTADGLAQIVHRALIHVQNHDAVPVTDLTGY